MKLIINTNYPKLYEEAAKTKVLEVLFKYPEKEFSLSDLAEESSVAKANIGNILEKFRESNLITIEKLSKIWRIKANQTNELFIKSKIIYNLNFIYKSSLIEFLKDYYNNPKAIILFGSFRKGEDISNSDIDIAIEYDKIKEHKINELKIDKIDKKMQIHLFNRESIDINLFNNIANGIVLWGFLEVKK
ncbi:MAG: nucleotidyltransferase domain-containing protein [Candidatus Nanoarchaeia archaeon]|nr:nucleotidyltransferase domain-containing protein [Candidatus Nanoarchaeia archaeon]